VLTLSTAICGAKVLLALETKDPDSCGFLRSAP
jgi:hypothetical protein